MGGYKVEDLARPWLRDWSGSDQIEQWQTFLRSPMGCQVLDDQLKSAPPPEVNCWLRAKGAAQRLRWTIRRVAAGVTEQLAAMKKLFDHTWCIAGDALENPTDLILRRPRGPSPSG